MSDPDLQIRERGGGGGHPDPEIRGRGPGLQKNIFGPFGPHLGLKIRGGGEGASPGISTVFLVTLNLVRRVLGMLVSP